MAKNLESPNFKIERPGESAFDAAANAQALEREHTKWHEEHPNEMCPPKFSNIDYSAIERADDLMMFAGGGTIEPGDAYGPKGGK